MAGVLERIGPFRWRLVIPWPQSTSKLDVFELTPVALTAAGVSEAGLLADPQEVRAILVASAAAGEAITYSEVLGLLGHDFTRPKMRALCKVLGYRRRRSAGARRARACGAGRAPVGRPAGAGLVGRRGEEARLHRPVGRAGGGEADPAAAAPGVRILGGTARLAFANRRAVTEARTFTVDEDDDGIRLDRWFKRHMPEVSFNIVSRWARTGQLRLSGKRAAPGDRIEAGQEIRVPPAEAAPARSAQAAAAGAIR